jgi:hypothetical protein
MSETPSVPGITASPSMTAESIGSRDVGMRLLPEIRPNSSPDRQRDLAAWKQLAAVPCPARGAPIARIAA